MNTRLVQNGFIAGILAIACFMGGSASAQPVSVYGAGTQIRLGTGVGITFGGGRIGVNIGTGGGYYPYQNYGYNPYRYPSQYQQPLYQPRYVTPYCDHHHPVAPVYPAPRYYSPQQPNYYSPRPYNNGFDNDAYSRQEQQQREWQEQQNNLQRENERHQRELDRIRNRR